MESDPTTIRDSLNGETPLQLQNDSLNLLGSTTICGISYGVMMTLLVICASGYRKNIRRSRPALFQLIYISTMAIFGTFSIVSSVKSSDLAYVYNRNFEGGPAEYHRLLWIFDEGIMILGSVGFVAANWMADGLLLWRLSVIYRSSQYHILVLIGPSMMFLASFGMGLVTLVQSTRPDSTFWGTTSVRFALAYCSLTVGITIVATGLVIFRLLMFRKRFKIVLGSDYADEYTNLAGLLVESSALYTIWSVIWLGLYIVNHPVQHVFLASLAQVQIISPLLIFHRVCQGTAWNSTREATLSTMEARTGTHFTGSQNLNSIGTVANGGGVAVHIIVGEGDEECRFGTHAK